MKSVIVACGLASLAFVSSAMADFSGENTVVEVSCWQDNGTDSGDLVTIGKSASSASIIAAVSMQTLDDRRISESFGVQENDQDQRQQYTGHGFNLSIDTDFIGTTENHFAVMNLSHPLGLTFDYPIQVKLICKY